MLRYHRPSMPGTTTPELKEAEMVFKFTMPRLKVGYDKTIINYNSSAMPILRYWDCLEDRKIPDFVLESYPEILNPKSKNSHFDIDVRYNNYVLHFFIVPFPEAGYVGFYGDFMPNEEFQ